MLRWLAGKLDDAGNAAAEREARKFLANLRQCTDLQIANRLILAHATRMRGQKETPDQALFPSKEDLESMEQYMHRSEVEGLLMKAAKHLRSKGDGGTEQALRLWICTLWGYRIPELRPLVGEIWQQMGRGFPALEEAREKYGHVYPGGISDELIEQSRRIPPIYEPLSADSNS